MRSRILAWAAGAFVVAGFCISGYLFLRTILLIMGRSHALPDVCSYVSRGGCDAVLFSDASIIASVPIAGWGLVYFSGLGALCMTGLLLSGEFRRIATTACAVVSSAGALVSLYLLMLLLRGTVPFCALCVTVHVLNLALVFIFVRISGGIREITRALRTGLGFVVRGTAGDTGANFGGKTLGLVSCALFAGLVYQWVAIQYHRAQTDALLTPAPDELLMQHMISPIETIHVSDEDPRLGAADAPVQIVVFSDFQCAGCGQLARRLHDLFGRYPESVSIVFKHFPLDAACNPLIKTTVHDQACRAAFDAEAMRRSGRFWAFHDAVFENSPLTDATLDGFEEQFAIPRPGSAEMDTDGRRIRHDIEIAAAHHIDSTPAVFMNGRRVQDLSSRALALLTAHHLGSALDTARVLRSR